MKQILKIRKIQRNKNIVGIIINKNFKIELKENFNNFYKNNIFIMRKIKEVEE
jgi:hypothetical protein